MQLGAPRRVLLPTVVVIVMTVGCSGSDSPEIDVVSVGTVHMAVETEEFTGAVGGFGMGGPLALLPGGCIGIDGYGVDDTVLVFPVGASLEGTEKQPIVTYDESEVQIGDELDLGGRGRGGKVSGTPELAEQLPQECQDFEVVFLDAMD